MRMKNESEALIEQSWMCMLFRHKRHMLASPLLFLVAPACPCSLRCSVDVLFATLFFFGLASSAMFVPGFVFPPLLKCSSVTLASRRKWVHTRRLVRQAHFFPTAPARWAALRVIRFTAVISVYNRQRQLILAGLWHWRKDVKPNNRQSKKLYPKTSYKTSKRWQTEAVPMEQRKLACSWIEMCHIDRRMTRSWLIK